MISKIMKFNGYLIVILCILFVFPLKISAEEKTSLSIHYVDIENLTHSQKRNIIYSEPKIEVHKKNNDIQLVYRKIDKVFISSNENNYSRNIITTSEATLNNVPRELLNKKSYPRTGERINPHIIVLGFVILLLVSIFYLLNRKRINKIIIIGIVAGSIGTVNNLAVNAEKVINELAPIKVEQLLINSIYSCKIPNISGYEYVGYLDINGNNSDSLKEQKGFVTVKYCDENLNELDSQIILSGNVGEAYASKPKKILGYELARSPDNTIGKYTKKNQTVTYIYKAIPTFGIVEIHYVDDSGKQIADPQTLTGEVGSEYQTTAKAISGYNLVRTPDNASGKYKNEIQVVNYVYKVENIDASIRIKFVDNSGVRFKAPNLMTTKNGSLVPIYPNLEKYEWVLNYNNQRYQQDQFLEDIVIPTKIGEEYSLPEKMKFTMRDENGNFVDYLMSPNEDGSSSGPHYCENIHAIPNNIQGKVTNREIVVTYIIELYWVATPAP